jgi:hypothetical protein
VCICDWRFFTQKGQKRGGDVTEGRVVVPPPGATSVGLGRAGPEEDEELIVIAEVVEIAETRIVCKYLMHKFTAP